MHDIKFIRSYPEEFEKLMRRRGLNIKSSFILEIDTSIRGYQTEIQTIQQKRNTASKEIGKLLSIGSDVSSLKLNLENYKSNLSKLDNKIKKIDYVLYTHNHADQTHGINELRVFFLKNKKEIPIFADKKTKQYLLNSFNYCFKKQKNYPAILKFFELNKNLNFKNSIKIQPIEVKHGFINSISYILYIV